MANIKIKQIDKRTEIYIDDKPIPIKWLANINLDMRAGKKNVLTLNYHADDVEIETDEGIVKLSNEKV